MTVDTTEVAALPRVLPRVWALADAVRDTRDARGFFVVRRLEEINDPTEGYNAIFKKALIDAKNVIKNIPIILKVPADKKLLSSMRRDEYGAWLAFRYLAGPPISDDDLETLVDASVTLTALAEDKDLADRVVKIFMAALDNQRFAWVHQRRFVPTIAEFEAACLATATAMASQRMQTSRRSDENVQMESGIANLLDSMGFVDIGRPIGGSIKTEEELPKPLTYLQHCNVGTHNADFVIGLHDGRALLMECKASNSELNGRKRLNKEIERDTEHWKSMFGEKVVPAAMLRGVFKPSTITEAQVCGLYIFWEHKLDELIAFINAAR